jgi:hypothetical protein
LTEQRKEFKETRDVFHEQSKIYTQQSKTLELQQFESTYFNMLQLHHQIVESIDITKYKKYEKITSRDCFEHFCNELNIAAINSLKNQNVEFERLLNEEYQLVYNKYRSDLGPYFNNLYNILKFINRKQPDWYREGNRFYSNLLRAQLSTYELWMLFFHCQGNIGKSEFKGYIETYQMFKELPLKDSKYFNEFKQWYKPEAFG